jgi:hypothetical protein
MWGFEPQILNKTCSILVNSRQTSRHILSIIDPNQGVQVIIGGHNLPLPPWRE